MKQLLSCMLKIFKQFEKLFSITLTNWNQFFANTYSVAFNMFIVLLKRPFTYLSSSYEVVGNYSFLGKGLLDPQTKLF